MLVVDRADRGVPSLFRFSGRDEPGDRIIASPSSSMDICPNPSFAAG